MAEATRLLTDSGCREAILWVLESNQRARRFYEAAGWRADGGHKIDESYGFPMSLVRYRRRLDQPEG
jgi:Acetyltransferase (GNAT) family.